MRAGVGLAGLGEDEWWFSLDSTCMTAEVAVQELSVPCQLEWPCGPGGRGGTSLHPPPSLSPVHSGRAAVSPLPHRPGPSNAHTPSGPTPAGINGPSTRPTASALASHACGAWGTAPTRPGAPCCMAPAAPLSRGRAGRWCPTIPGARLPFPLVTHCLGMAATPAGPRATPAGPQPAGQPRACVVQRRTVKPTTPPIAP